MNFYYVIVIYAPDNVVTFPCKSMREAKEIANMKRQLFETADIIITKAIYSELKVRVDI